MLIASTKVITKKMTKTHTQEEIEENQNTTKIKILPKIKNIK